jgi:hypothetical protein
MKSIFAMLQCGSTSLMNMGSIPMQPGQMTGIVSISW